MSRLLYKDNSLKFLYLESQLEGTQIKFRNCGREKQFKTALVNRPKYSQILVDFLWGVTKMGGLRSKLDSTVRRVYVSLEGVNVFFF